MVKPLKASASKSGVVVVDEGRDEWGGRFLRFALVSDGIKQGALPPFPMNLIGANKREFFDELNNAGAALLTNASQQKLLKDIEEHQPSKQGFKVATCLGWHGLAYVFPDKTFGSADELVPVFRDIDAQIAAKYRTSPNRDLADWQEQIASFCVGNSRLMFAVSLAFTGPILRFSPVEPKSGGFQIYGKGETGKSTAAMVAGSVWGCRKDKKAQGFMDSWNNTANALEPVALAHNDGLLILDETKLAGDDDIKRAKTIFDVVFRLSEGKEKGRLTGVQSPRTSRCYFLSTSNHPIAELAKRGKQRIDEAAHGRLVDIPLPAGPHGIYENLHNYSSGREFTNYLKRRCTLCYGTPIRAFLAKLVKLVATKNGRKRLVAYVTHDREQYLKNLPIRAKKLSVSAESLERASERFATVYAAGCLAIRFGVLKWDRM